jgi:glutathione reductase (NADPH)
MEFDYDLFVIGGGSGGVRAARLTALDGHRVAIAEESRMGGTCVIRGCVPKKLMVFASLYSGEVRAARNYGWDASVGAFDWPGFRTRMHAELDRLEGVYTSNAEKAGCEIFHQRARLRDPHTVELADGTVKTAKHILFAVGGAPFVPPLENADLGIVSDDVFHLDEVPERMLIVGGGYIGCEFAGVFNALGSEVTMFIRAEQILRGFDGEARDHVARAMSARGIDIHAGCEPTAIEKRGNRLRVTGSDGSVAEVDCLLWATGRNPTTDDMGLDEAGVRRRENGAIEVDAHLQTNVPSIYALGDCIGRVELTPVAIREAICFHETVFRGNPTEMDYDLIPTATFTQPEMGTVGLTEEEAEGKGPIRIYSTAFRPLQQAFVGGEERVLMKLLVSEETDRVVGAHLVGPTAGEMIQYLGIAVKAGLTKADFDRTCAVHPTMAEEIVTLREPVRTLS